MNELFGSINPIYITAISTLLGVMITLYFTNMRERSKILIDYKFKEHNELKDFYIKLIASIDKAKRITKNGDTFISLVDEVSMISAKTYIIGSTKVNDQVIIISSLLYNWTSKLKEEKPKCSVGENFTMRTIEENKYLEATKEIEASLNREIGILIKIIKNELNENRKVMS